MARLPGDERAAAIAASLAPFDWRGFTDRMLARRVVGAVDEHDVRSFLDDLPGVGIGAADPLEPADPDDERVDVLIGELEGRPWRAWSLACLSVWFTTALDAWLAERDSFHSGLRRLLEGS